MRGSLYLGAIRGIRLFVHWTFSILIGYVVLQQVRMGAGAGQVLAGDGEPALEVAAQLVELAADAAQLRKLRFGLAEPARETHADHDQHERGGQYERRRHARHHTVDCRPVP